MPGRVRAGRPRECGQTTVEAAFGLPIVFLLVLLLAQPGIVLYDRMVMASAASEACRLLATGEGSISSSVAWALFPSMTTSMCIVADAHGR